MTLQIQLAPYSLPLAFPWPGVQGARLTQREGWIISIRDNRHNGYGDCAPFPAAGTESMAAAHKLLQQFSRRTWDSTQTLLAELGQQYHDCPAACYALETATLDLHSQNTGIPLRKLLSTTASDQVLVNAMGGSACQENVRDAQGQGFTVIKLKVGKRELEEEIRCLENLSASLVPETRLRLDANGSWNQDEARYFLDAAAELSIESLEEPLHNPSLAEFALLQSHTPITLALDESIRLLSQKELLATLDIRRLVLKPGVQGGLRHSYSLAEKATAAGKECVVTSLVDSAVGVHAACQLAAAVDGLSPGLAHGLATSSWLCQDVARPPQIEAGVISLPDIPGLGVDEIFQANLSGTFS
ncbi:o-succinylbenzoate synthase [Thiolapillus sp.]